MHYFASESSPNLKASRLHLPNIFWWLECVHKELNVLKVITIFVLNEYLLLPGPPTPGPSTALQPPQPRGGLQPPGVPGYLPGPYLPIDQGRGMGFYDSEGLWPRQGPYVMPLWRDAIQK